MSIMMTLEAKNNLPRSDILNALATCKVSLLTSTESKTSGNFPRSNMFFVLEIAEEDETEIFTGSFENPPWVIANRIAFHFAAGNLDLSSTELHEFIETLNKLSTGYFLLSFQYEILHAIKDENGFRVIANF